tara:strand:- start:84354 stop:85247 length:894 start_codon:yes stop_codon:yes gene_type:complete
MRIGIDIGGSKIAAIAINSDGILLSKTQIPVSQNYSELLSSIFSILESLETNLNMKTASLGISVAGHLSLNGNILSAANLPWIVGKDLRSDLRQAFPNCKISIANDAKCFAISESYDGAGANSKLVFGATLGTGVGGGIVFDGNVLDGVHGICSEWGHIPMPWRKDDDGDSRLCACGKCNCIESWINGKSLSTDYQELSGNYLDAKMITKKEIEGDPLASKALKLYSDRLARALAMIVNILDPDIIVLGGGLSEIKSIYNDIPIKMRPFTIIEKTSTRIVKAHHGQISSALGAARLA